MRPGSAALVSSLENLHERLQFDASYAGVGLIDAIAKQSHPVIAVALAPLALVCDVRTSKAAARALHEVLLRQDEKGLLWITREGRHWGIGKGYWHDLWYKLRPNEVTDRLECFGEDSVGLLCIGSVHPQGYVRQVCLQRLANYNGSLPFAFQFLRINDWVPPVRIVARNAVLARLNEAQRDPVRCREFLDNIVLTESMDKWTRDDHGQIRDALASVLVAHPLADEIDDPRHAQSFARIMRLHRMTLEQQARDPFAFLQKTLTSPRAPLRMWAAREAVRRLEGEPLRTLVATMENDASGAVRYEAVFALATKCPPLQPSTLIPFLHDSSPEVRFLAGYYLEKTRFDLRGYFLDALAQATEADLAALIAGVGERGKPGDEAAVAKWAEHGNPHVRRAVVFVLGKFRRDTDLSWIFKALHDPHKLVVREAARQMEERMHIADPQAIEEWFRFDPRLSLRREAIRIGAKLERWEALIFLLHAALVDDPILRADVDRELRRWLQRFVDWYARPNSETIRRIEEAYMNGHMSLDVTLSGWIRQRLGELRKR